MSSYEYISKERVLEGLRSLPGHEVVIVGDVMLDEYLIGDARRISPEAPVPVVLIAEERCMLGGAGNVARNISALGGRARLIGLCGDGHNSEKFAAIIEQENIQTDLVCLPGRPVSTKTRLMARNQQLVRIDREDPALPGPEATAALLQKLDQAWPKQGVVIISDYAKGVVSQTFMAGLQSIRHRRGGRTTVLLDPKPVNFPLYHDLDMLTPNCQETGEAAAMPVNSKEQIICAGQTILAKSGCKKLLTTLGAEGMALFQNPQEILHLPTAARHVFDVSGAGDTVIATLGLGLSAGLGLVEACIIANFAAGNVVAEIGAATTTIQDIATGIDRFDKIPLSRWL